MSWPRRSRRAPTSRRTARCGSKGDAGSGGGNPLDDWLDPDSVWVQFLVQLPCWPVPVSSPRVCGVPGRQTVPLWHKRVLWGFRLGLVWLSNHSSVHPVSSGRSVTKDTPTLLLFVCLRVALLIWLRSLKNSDKYRSLTPCVYYDSCTASDTCRSFLPSLTEIPNTNIIIWPDQNKNSLI